MSNPQFMTDENKQLKWQFTISNKIRKSFLGADLAGIEKVLKKMTNTIKKEQKKEIAKMVKKGIITQEEAKGYAEQRSMLVDSKCDALKELISLVKSGEKITPNYIKETIWHRETPRYVYYHGAYSGRKDPVIGFYVKNKYNSEADPDRVEAKDAPPAETERQFLDLVDEVSNYLTTLAEWDRNSGYDTDFKDNNQRKEWSIAISEHIQKKENEYIDQSLVTEQDRDVICNVAERRLHKIVEDIYNGELILPGIDPRDKEYSGENGAYNLACRLSDTCHMYSFLTPLERGRRYFWGGKKIEDSTSNISSDDDFKRHGEMDVAEIYNLINSGRTSTYLWNNLRMGNSPFSSDRNALNYYLKDNDIKEKYSNITLAADFEKNAAKLDKINKETKAKLDLAKMAAANVGKEEIDVLKQEDAKMTKSFNSLYRAVKDLRPGYDKAQMLNTLMSAMSREKEPAKAKAAVLGLADGVKRTFWQKLFFKERNQYADKLQTLLSNASKGKKTELTIDDLTEMREAAEDLKFSIDAGKELGKPLSELNQKRYELAKNVLSSLTQSVQQASGEDVLQDSIDKNLQ